MDNHTFLSAKETEAFGQALKQINESLENLNTVFQRMQPEVLTMNGLKQAFIGLADLIKTGYRLSTNFIFEGDAKRIGALYEQATYKIAVELITNVIQHANATSLTLRLVQNENRLTLTIKDNGKGFDPTLSDGQERSGLTHIRTQLKNYKGWMVISSEPGHGTEISVELNW